MLSSGPVTKQTLGKCLLNWIWQKQLFLTSNKRWKNSKKIYNLNTLHISTQVSSHKHFITCHLPWGLWMDVATVLREASLCSAEPVSVECWSEYTETNCGKQTHGPHRLSEKMHRGRQLLLIIKNIKGPKGKIIWICYITILGRSWLLLTGTYVI